MKTPIVFSTLVIACLGAHVNPVAHFLDIVQRSRILNGVPAADGEYPFLVSLQLYHDHYCGATVLNSEYLLTAAHCVYGKHVHQYTVRAGTNDFNSGGTVHHVIDWRMHKDYVDGAYWNDDVAVVKVHPPLTLGDKVQTIKLTSKGVEPIGGTEGLAVGWGSVCYGCVGIANLQKVTLRVYSDQECFRLYEEGPTPDMVCAGKPENEQGICSGDSGGPLLVNGIQIGITSWTRIPCGILPAVWTKVSHYIDWIEENSSF